MGLNFNAGGGVVVKLSITSNKFAKHDVIEVCAEFSHLFTGLRLTHRVTLIAPSMAPELQWRCGSHFNSSTRMMVLSDKERSMQQFGLCSSAVLALLLAVVSQSNWPSHRSQSNSTPSPRPAAQKPADIWSNPSACRWFHGEPTHWRAMLLNH